MSTVKKRANRVNNKGKTEKNAKVKEGDCIFPFKYKWKEHHDCFETPLGDICATEINPKSRTLVKYGYCIKPEPAPLPLPSPPKKLPKNPQKKKKNQA